MQTECKELRVWVAQLVRFLVTQRERFSLFSVLQFYIRDRSIQQVTQVFCMHFLKNATMALTGIRRVSKIARMIYSNKLLGRGRKGADNAG
jgi:hypothetical protein